jgi:acetyltransferase-like isoleucine patch superfamily enzyme
MSQSNSLTSRLLAPLQDLIRQAVAEHEERHPHGEPEDPLTRMLVHGDRSRLHIAATATVNNALFNLSAGEVTIRDHAFFGHNVSVLTGTHDVTKFGAERKNAHPREGRDVVVGEGVWVASNATIIGPCTIGDHAVVGACSLVQGDVEPYTVVAGVPAKEIRRIDHPGDDGGEGGQGDEAEEG